MDGVSINDSSSSLRFHFLLLLWHKKYQNATIFYGQIQIEVNLMGGAFPFSWPDRQILPLKTENWSTGKQTLSFWKTAGKSSELIVCTTSRKKFDSILK